MTAISAPKGSVISRLQFTLTPPVSTPTIVKSIIATITKPPAAGYLNGCWGTDIEAPNTIEVWTAWESNASCNAFLASSQYLSLGYHLTPLLAPGTRVCHQVLTFSPPPILPSLLSLPVTEIQTFFGPQNIHFPDKSKAVKGLVGRLAGNVQGKVEILVCEGKERELEKRRAVVVVIGWDAFGSKEERAERDMRDGYRFLFFDDEEEKGIERERAWVSFRSF